MTSEPNRSADAAVLPAGAASTSMSTSVSDDGLFAAGRAGACVGAVALISLVAFEAMAVAAAMPAVAEAVDGVGAYALAFGGPLAASVLGMVLAGHSCDRHGAWRATAWGLLLFAAGLVTAGLANGMAQVVGGRVLQGLGGGMLGVALYVGMGQVVPKPLHPRLFSLFATAWVVPGLVGPAIAAGLVAQLGWRSVFLVVAGVAPIAALLLLPALRRQPRPALRADDGAGRRIAWAAAAAGGALLMHAAAEGHGSAWAWVPLAGLVLAGVAATRLLPRGTLRVAPGLPAVIALRGLLAAAFFTAEAFVPLALTRLQGWTLAQAGLALSAAAVCWSTGSWVQSRLHLPRHRRAGLVVGIGLLGLAVASLGAVFAFGLPGVWAVVMWAVGGFGIGLSFPMLSVLLLGLSSPEEQGRNASALQLADALGTSASLAIAGLLFAATGGATVTGSFVAVLGLAAALAFTGAWLGRRAFVAAA